MYRMQEHQEELSNFTMTGAIFHAQPVVINEILIAVESFAVDIFFYILWICSSYFSSNSLCLIICNLLLKPIVSRVAKAVFFC